MTIQSKVITALTTVVIVTGLTFSASASELSKAEEAMDKATAHYTELVMFDKLTNAFAYQQGDYAVYEECQSNGSNCDDAYYDARNSATVFFNLVLKACDNPTEDMIDNCIVRLQDKVENKHTQESLLSSIISELDPEWNRD